MKDEEVVTWSKMAEMTLGPIAYWGRDCDECPNKPICCSDKGKIIPIFEETMPMWNQFRMCRTNGLLMMMRVEERWRNEMRKPRWGLA